MSSLPTRPLGATGEDVSILGMGGGHVAGANSDDREVVRVIQHAIEQGVTFMDNAWEYSDGRSERLMGEAIQGRRDELFVMTKVCARDRAGALSNLEDSLRRLRTDVIDLWQFHEINYATDPELVFAADGAAEAAHRALADGKVRFVGTTGHKEPGYLMAMLEHEFPWSTVQMPVTVLDPHYKSFIATVLPETQRRSIGVIGMKALGGNAGFLTGAGLSLAECLGFALSQPISVLVSGMTTVDEVDQNTAVARDFAPMSPEEQAALQARVRPLAADGRFEKYKSTQAFDSPPHRAQHGFALTESVVAVKPADRYGNAPTGGPAARSSQVAGVAGTTLACDNAPIMAGRLADKVAIVTGGNSGMGAGTVELFVAEGARVVIAARGEELGQAVADRLGDNALFVRADVSVEADVKAMVDATMAKWGRVDVLFNNAGIGQGFVPPEDFALDDFNRVMTTNLGSCFLGLKYVTPIMKEQGGGSIINNGSTAGVTTDGSGPVYSASKAAVIHITKVWATQLAEFGIRVNCISPGAIVTPIFWGGYQTQSVEENERREQRLTEHFANALPLNRAGTPEDIAYAALYLASDESRHTTGHNLMVDAGITVRMAAQAGLVEGFDAIRRSVSSVS